MNWRRGGGEFKKKAVKKRWWFLSKHTVSTTVWRQEDVCFCVQPTNREATVAAAVNIGKQQLGVLGDWIDDCRYSIVASTMVERSSRRRQHIMCRARRADWALLLLCKLTYRAVRLRVFGDWQFEYRASIIQPAERLTISFLSVSGRVFHVPLFFFSFLTEKREITVSFSLRCSLFCRISVSRFVCFPVFPMLMYHDRRSESNRKWLVRQTTECRFFTVFGQILSFPNSGEES